MDYQVRIEMMTYDVSCHKFMFSMFSRLADDQYALDATQQVLQPKYLDTDILQMRQWALASGPGFYTYPHVDGSGLGTWLYLTAGAKEWSLLRPKKINPSKEESLPTGRRHSKRKAIPEELKYSEVYEMFKRMAECVHDHADAAENLPDLADTYNFLLRPGSLL